MNNSENRREFLKKAGLGIAGLSVVPDLLANSKTLDFKNPKKVELAIATITMDGFGDHNFEKAFEILPKLPFKNVEFNCWYARTLTPAGIREYQRKMPKA
jgi:hypothetical protein